jgi:hypothetical protein
VRRFAAAVCGLLLVVGGGGAIGAAKGTSPSTGMSVLSPSGGDARAFGTSVDASGNSYITGYVTGRLPGAPERWAGVGDAFVAKFGADGSAVWVHQLGTRNEDVGRGVATDASGNVYVAGWTDGRLPGSSESYYGFDVFVAKFSPSGARLWVHELGSSTFDRAYAIAVDAKGNSFITGYSSGHLPGAPEHLRTGTEHAFVAKYTSTGSRAWVHEIGDGVGDGIALDTTGAVYLTGFDLGVRSGPTHAFIARCSKAGTLQWFHQATTNTNDEPRGIAVGSDGFYVTGSVGIPESAWDAFVTKYSTNGSERWRRQYGTDRTDVANGITTSGSGIYIAGSTSAHLPGAPETNPKEISETFVTRYSASGTRIWTHQIATGAPNYGQGIALDQADHTYLTGWTVRQPPDTRAGRDDAYVVRFP